MGRSGFTEEQARRRGEWAERPPLGRPFSGLDSTTRRHDDARQHSLEPFEQVRVDEVFGPRRAPLVADHGLASEHEDGASAEVRTDP